MGIFKRQERRQQRKKAREEELDAKRAARDAAEEARHAAAAELEERARRREAVLVAAKAKQRAAAKKRRHDVARPFSSAPTPRETIASLKRGADEAAAADQKKNGRKKRKTASAGSVTAEGGKKTIKGALAHTDKGEEKPRHKQKVLLLASRGISFRHRHLMNDLEAVLPHAKKGAKLDTKSDLKLINEVAELSNCNGCMFFEVREREDLNLWLSKTPNGPSIKFHVENVHTISELKMTGNCLRGTRHILSFDKNFDGEPHMQLMKHMFTQLFAVPRTSRRVKPFVDHVISFTVADGRVWIRNFQIAKNSPPSTTASSKISDKEDNRAEDDDVTLVEIGPRLVLNPIRILAGSFGGWTVYANSSFTSPARVRALTKHLSASRHKSRQLAGTTGKEKRQAVRPEEDAQDGTLNEN